MLFRNLFFLSYIILFLGQLSEIVNQGKLLSDDIIFLLLSKRLETGEGNGESGFILDGFPRTVRQAVSILAMIKRRHVQVYIGLVYPL